MIPKAVNKKAKCIQDGDNTYYFCVCPEGFVGDPHKECKPEIVKEPCEKCGQYLNNTNYGIAANCDQHFTHSIGDNAECCREEEGSLTYSCICPDYLIGDPYHECLPDLVSFSSSQSSGWYGGK